MKVSTKEMMATGQDKQKIRVLMVDDEVTLTRIAKINLEAEGCFEVRTVNHAVEAVDEALRFDPDIILLDVMMPDGDGGDLAANLKEQPRLGRIPIVFITAAIRKSEAQQSRGKIGGRTYLAKPVTTDEMVSVIKEELAQ